MKNVLLLLFLQLNLVFGTVNKCGYNLLQQCYCGLQFHDNRSMFVVECAGLGFTSTDMLRELPDETEMLIFTGNHVGTLPSNVFGENRNMTKLRIIDMSNNGIQDIKGKAFHHVIGVTRLILNHNNISISAQYDKNFHHPRVFSNFVNLEELHLTNAFADNTGSSLADDLHDIFVNSNLTKLYKIHLEQNEIKNFKDDRVFCDLPNIHDIYLGTETISEKLEDLELNLQINQIESISVNEGLHDETEQIQNLDEVEMIFTDGNVNEIKGNNNIPSLNFNITCLPKLRYLDLEKNNITKFSYQDLENFDKLAYPYRTTQNLTLDIDGNPFRCDQAINNLYNWLHKTNVKVRDLEMLQCHQIKYGTEYIMNLKILAESKNAKISQALTVLLIVLVFILLTLLSAYAYLKKDSLKTSLSPIFESVTRKVQYNKIESQDVYV